VVEILNGRRERIGGYRRSRQASVATGVDGRRRGGRV